MAKLSQDQLLEIFTELKKIIEPYQKEPIRPRLDLEGKYDLWSEKEVMADGKQRDSIAFVALILQTGYVGFYFMPVYTNVDIVKPQLGEVLLKTLKGKSCFHIKNTDPALMNEVREAMKLGYDVYKKQGWV